MEPARSEAHTPGTSQVTMPHNLSICTLGYHPRGKAPIVIGILLHDEVQDRLWLDFPLSMDQFVEPDDLDIVQSLAEDLRDMSKEMGPSVLVAYLQDTLSNTIMISDSAAVEAVGDV